jgi:hypothetical protein
MRKFLFKYSGGYRTYHINHDSKFAYFLNDLISFIIRRFISISYLIKCNHTFVIMRVYMFENINIDFSTIIYPSNKENAKLIYLTFQYLLEKYEISEIPPLNSLNISYTKYNMSYA